MVRAGAPPWVSPRVERAARTDTCTLRERGAPTRAWGPMWGPVSPVFYLQQCPRAEPGKGSLAQTCSDNIPKILFQQFAVRSFLHHRCCFQSGLSKIGFMPLFYPSSLKAISTLSFSWDKNKYIYVHWKLLFNLRLLWVMLDLPHSLWSTHASSSCTWRSILIPHILISKYW